MLNNRSVTSDSKEDLNIETGLPYTKRVMKFDNGKLFKGHGGGINIIGDNISLFNSYYLDSVNQCYNSKDDITTREYMVHGNMPKYISKQFNNLDFTFKFNVNINTNIIINEFSIRIEKLVKENKIRFHDHWDNINHLKDIRVYMVKFKKYMKLNPELLNSIEVPTFPCKSEHNLIEVKHIKI
tara:strand:+ start:755 stop:1303 length:549 start_codon:yes stop_codon:yes gene_type:complete